MLNCPEKKHDASKGVSVPTTAELESLYHNIDFLRWYASQPGSNPETANVADWLEGNEKLTARILEIPRYPLNSFDEIDGADLAAMQNELDADSIANEAQAAYNCLMRARKGVTQ